MRCNVCGADNLEGAAYCEDCGARLPVASAPVTQEAPAVAHQPVVAAPPPLPTPVPVPVPVAAPAVEPVAAVPAPSFDAPPPPIPAPEATPPVASSVLVCPACAAQNPPGVAFCEDCGASLSDTPTTAAAAAVAPPVVYDAPTQVTVPPPACGPASRTLSPGSHQRPRISHGERHHIVG